MEKKTVNRCIWLLNTLLQSRGLTLEELNERWMRSCLGDGKKLSRTTFNAHCGVLADMLGVEIKCDHHNHYKYYVASRSALHSNRMNQWLLNSFSLSNMIEAGHNMQKRILLEDIPQGTEYLQMVIDAMQQGRELYVEHQKFGSQKTVQHLQPYAMKAHRQRWYVVGYIHEHKAIRTVALDRVLSMDLTNEKYAVPEDFDAERYYAHSIGIYVRQGVQPEKVLLRAYGVNVNYLRSLPLHQSQREVETRAGEYSDFQYDLCLTPDLTNEILSMGEMVEVLQPETLRTAVRERLQANLSRYL